MFLSEVRVAAQQVGQLAISCPHRPGYAGEPEHDRGRGVGKKLKHNITSVSGSIPDKVLDERASALNRDVIKMSNTTKSLEPLFEGGVPTLNVSAT